MKYKLSKVLQLTTLITTTLTSCIVDVVYPIRIKNLTTDSIYCGLSKYNNIDSINYMLLPEYTISNDKRDSIKPYLWNGINIHESIVLPDSVCSNNMNALFEDTDTGYIFIIPRQVALKYTMNEIRTNQLYDKITVVRNKRNEGLRIDYMGKNGAAICKNDRDHATLYFTKGKKLIK